MNKLENGETTEELIEKNEESKEIAYPKPLFFILFLTIGIINNLGYVLILTGSQQFSSQLKNEISIDEPLNTDRDGNELLLCDILGSDAEEINQNLEREDERQLVLSEVKKLCPRECRIVELRFGLNGNTEHTQKQVADMMGISQSYISRLEKKIIKRLKCGLSVG